MDKIKIEYQIPETKADITLKQWLDWQDIVNEHKDNLDSLYVMQKMIEIFCKVPFQHVIEMKQIEIDEMLGYIHLVFNQKSEFKKTFTFNGVEYGFIASYRDDITTAEHFDLNTHLEAGNWANILSILYRPITKKVANTYQIEPYNGTHTEFLELGYDIYDGCIGFFLRTMQQLSKQTLLFTQKEVMKLSKNPMIMNQHLPNLTEVVQNLNSLTGMEFFQNLSS